MEGQPCPGPGRKGGDSGLAPGRWAEGLESRLSKGAFLPARTLAGRAGTRPGCLLPAGLAEPQRSLRVGQVSRQHPPPGPPPGSFLPRKPSGERGWPRRHRRRAGGPESQAIKGHERPALQAAPWLAPEPPPRPTRRAGLLESAVLGWGPSRQGELGPARRGPRGRLRAQRSLGGRREPRGKAPPWRGAGSVRRWEVGVQMGGSPGRSLRAGPPWGTSVGWGPDVCSGPRPGRNSGRKGCRAVWRVPLRGGVPEPPPQEPDLQGQGLHWSWLPLPQFPHQKPRVQRLSHLHGEGSCAHSTDAC